MSKSILGVDIGASEIKFALFSRGNVQRLCSETMPDNLVRDGRILSPEAMSQFLRETAAKLKLGRRDCAVILPDSLAFTRRTVMPLMTVEQLKINLPYEFRDFITEDKDKYFYDYSVLSINPGDEEHSAEMELMATAALKEDIHQYVEIFRKAGMKLVTAMPVEFAYANLIRGYEAAHPDEAGLEHCLIDLGHAGTRVHIFKGASFEVTRVLEQGGALLDAAIAEAFNVDEHLAHAYKQTNHDGCLDAEACQSMYNNLAVEIMRAVNFYSYNNPGSSLTSAWVCGGGINPPLMEALQLTLSQQPLELMPITRLLPGIQNAQELEKYPAAIGVAMQ